MNLEEKILRRKIVYQGNYLRTEEQTVLLPDGKEAIREIVAPPNAVGILPLDAQENVYLVRQYRSAIGQITLEIPAGIFEPEESPLQTAQRECQEEIGMKPGRLDFLLSYYHSVGFSSGRIELYLARDLVSSRGNHTDPGEFLEVVKIPLRSLYEKISYGELVDSKTLLAVLWYRQFSA